MLALYILHIATNLAHMLEMIAKGGKTVPSNLQVLCSKCNGAKGAKTHEKDTIQKARSSQQLKQAFAAEKNGIS